MVAGRELRRRWRGTVAIALLVGIVGAIALATLAGARRSESALVRFNRYSRSSDAELGVAHATTSAQLRAFSRVPQVGSVAVVRTFAVESDRRSLQQLAIGATIDNRLGHVVDRARLISGRRADPDAANEVTIGEGLAAQARVGLGSVLSFHSFTAKQVA